jgi:hypothetical protein
MFLLFFINLKLLEINFQKKANLKQLIFVQIVNLLHYTPGV